METVKVKSGTVGIYQTAAELADAAAAEFARLSSESIAGSGRFVVALSGGSTPTLLYERLLKDDYRTTIQWDKIHFFVSDERCVPLESEDSNFGNAKRLFLEKLDIPDANLHQMHNQDTDPEQSSIDYELEVHRFFNGRCPVFDLILLGMGSDGHTASLFPSTKALTEGNRLVVDNFVEKLQATRITFTFALINQASNVMFLIVHEEKAAVLAEVLQSDTVSYPVQLVQPQSGNLYWLVDAGAAKNLQRTAQTH